jgi:CheY-like chemotaxis protein
MGRSLVYGGAGRGEEYQIALPAAPFRPNVLIERGSAAIVPAIRIVASICRWLVCDVLAIFWCAIGMHAAIPLNFRDSMEVDMTQPQADPPTILVIEDDRATIEFLELLLDMAGYRVQMAQTGAKGVAVATASTPQAILLDRRLPDMDGVAVCERLRSQLGLAMPVIMLTADYDSTLEAAVKAAGATALMRKPFEPDTLLEQLAAVFQG